MSRLIDAVSLIGNMMEAICMGYNEEDMLGIVNEEPTVDAVSVVRCKDCANNPSRSNQKGFCPRAGICMVCSDGYCDFGKKVTE